MNVSFDINKLFIFGVFFAFIFSALPISISQFYETQTGRSFSFYKFLLEAKRLFLHNLHRFFSEERTEHAPGETDLETIR